jgi:plastocyanin
MHPRTVLAAAVTALLLTGCASSGSSPSAPPAPHAAGDGYLVKDYTFPPLTAAPGQTVRVVDGDDEPHTLTAEDGSFDTGSFDKSEPGSFTAPSKPGTYPILCKIHPSMHGTLTVR